MIYNDMRAGIRRCAVDCIYVLDSQTRRSCHGEPECSVTYLSLPSCFGLCFLDKIDRGQRRGCRLNVDFVHDVVQIGPWSACRFLSAVLLGIGHGLQTHVLHIQWRAGWDGSCEGGRNPVGFYLALNVATEILLLDLRESLCFARCAEVFGFMRVRDFAVGKIQNA